MLRRLKIPAYSDPVTHWNFCKADWKHFCLLTGESVERLPPLDITNTKKAYQEICESLFIVAINNVSHQVIARTMCHAGIKSARLFIAPSSKPQWGLNSDRAALSLLPWCD